MPSWPSWRLPYRVKQDMAPQLCKYWELLRVKLALDIEITTEHEYPYQDHQWLLWWAELGLRKPHQSWPQLWPQFLPT